jgi:N6-L-threonylcarbamoyladenine synthase
MLILGIETSCDETAVAVVEGGRRVICSVLSSQSDHFASLGGVIPEDAARRQTECMLPVLHRCLEEARCSLQEMDAIAVTMGPGLLGSLLVGTTTARALAALWGKPLIGVHHTLGHLSSTWLHPRTPPKLPASPIPIPEPLFPVLTLSASGGHTDLWYRTSHTRGRLLGRTRDDAAGEAFDKGAQLLGLPYPGGPSISRAGETGNPSAYTFPLPLHDDPSLDFSCSGLKTALKYLLRKLPQESLAVLADLAASYEQAICSHLIDRIRRALQRYPDVSAIHIVGGVSANRRLRAMLCTALPESTVRFPSELHYCTDNAAMIAAAGEFLAQERGEEAFTAFTTQASLPLAVVVAAQCA